MPRTRPFDIMLVEDNPADVMIMREVMEDSRVWHRLIVHGNGEEAWKALQAGKETGAQIPDIILLDLNMPRMDGREFLTHLRADAQLKVIPVVILTTSKAHSDVVRSYQLHANAYITKPLDFQQFVDVLHAIEDLWLDLVELPTGVPAKA